MCGRYQRRADKQRIAEAFALGNIEGLAMDLDLAPNYNVAPGTMQPSSSLTRTLAPALCA